MPPKRKFTREIIIQTVLDITREKGYSAVTARSVAEKLGASPKVIFGCFENMEELHNEALVAVDRLNQQFITEDIAKNKYPPYKASGMAYIRFAKEETELFKLLYMRDRSSEAFLGFSEQTEPLITMIRKNLGLDRKKALEMHLQMWIYVHGIASMIATNYLQFDMEDVSRLLTDAYQGLRTQYVAKSKEN